MGRAAARKIAWPVRVGLGPSSPFGMVGEGKVIGKKESNPLTLDLHQTVTSPFAELYQNLNS